MYKQNVNIVLWYSIEYVIIAVIFVRILIGDRCGIDRIVCSTFNLVVVTV